VKFAWKVQRDVAERGWTEEQVRQGKKLKPEKNEILGTL